MLDLESKPAQGQPVVEGDVEVLVTLRMPPGARGVGVLSPKEPARRAFVRRLGDDVGADYAPFGVSVARALGQAFIEATVTEWK